MSASVVNIVISCECQHQLWMSSSDINRKLLTSCLLAAVSVCIFMKWVRSDSLDILMTFFTTSTSASHHCDATASTLQVVSHHTLFDLMRKRAAFSDKRYYVRSSTSIYLFEFDETLCMSELTDISSAFSSSSSFKAARRISASWMMKKDNVLHTRIMRRAWNTWDSFSLMH